MQGYIVMNKPIFDHDCKETFSAAVGQAKDELKDREGTVIILKPFAIVDSTTVLTTNILNGGGDSDKEGTDRPSQEGVV